MPKITIRVKLLLVAAALLCIPYIGFRYLRETERYLQSGLEESLLAISGSLAALLGQYPTLFQSSIKDQQLGDALFVHSLKHPVQIDGYMDDWIGYLDWSNQYQTPQEAAGDPQGLSFKIVLGQYGQDLFAMLQVRDGERKYQQNSGFRPHAADTLEMAFSDPAGNVQSHFFSTTAPGSVTAYRIIEKWDFSRTREPVANIVGEWQETPEGYTVEIRVPLHLVGDAMGFVVYDAGHGRTAVNRLGTAGDSTRVRPNKLIRNSAQLEQLMGRLQLKPGRRAWVLNRHGQVLASAGSLVSEVKRGAINVLYTWILPRAKKHFEDELAVASRLRGAEVLEALAGRAATQWRSSPDERAVIVSAASPVRLGNELIGAVMVEETTNSIQTLQRRAMADLFNVSILVLIGAAAVLLLFATRLSLRLLRLRNEAERAIDADGRVVGTVTGRAAGDEIGDLCRIFAAMLERLHQSNAQLESMASKLARELRTPLAVVTSALEDLEQQADHGDRGPHLERARDGAARLNDLLRGLSEAARREQSAATAEVGEFDLEPLLAGCVAGYAKAYPGKQFRFSGSAAHARIVGAPGLVVQMLDKLVENAIDFTADDEVIEIGLSSADGCAVVDVTNHGSSLSDDMRDRLLGSVVSNGGRIRSGRPPPGLGLYIVRLIMEFHRGTVTAESLPDGDGVRFRLRFPTGITDRESARQ